MTPNFEKLKSLLRTLALSNGITETELNGYDAEREEFSWHIDWRSDLDKLFERDMQRINDATELYDSAMQKGDLVAAKAALQHIRIASHNLMTFFDDIREDLIKFSSDSRFNWPNFPDDYKIPDHYDYPKI